MVRKNEYARLFVYLGMDSELNENLARFLGEFAPEAETSRCQTVDGELPLWEIPAALRYAVLEALRGEKVVYYHMLSNGTFRRHAFPNRKKAEPQGTKKAVEQDGILERLRKETLAVPR